MTFPVPNRLRASVAALALAAWPAAAQDSGFALEFGPPADAWIGARAALAVFGEAVEPAAAYVRGCPGHVAAEGAAAQVEVTARMEALTFTIAEDTVPSLVLGTPDGVFRCVLRGADGLIAVRLDGAGPGRYRLWPAGPEGGRIAARLIVADRPVPALELRGLDLARLGPARAGRHDLGVTTADEPRQQLAAAQPLVAVEAMDPLIQGEYCAGFSRFDAPDAVLTLASGEAALSLFAASEVDLTIAVRGPDGRVLCADDSRGLDPAVTFAPAPAGDYLVWVGAFGQGREGVYDLWASRGGPAWPGSGAYVEGAAPRLGYFGFDRARAAGGMVLARGDIFAHTDMNQLPAGTFCPGYGGLDAPDAVLTLAEAEPVLSLYARSDNDLVMAVRTPAGEWFCNDDAFGLNPAITLQDAAPGDYTIHVGAFSQGATGRFALYVAPSEPNWEGATETGAVPDLAPLAPPTVGRVAFGPATRIDPRLIFDIQPSQTEARGLGEGCVGFITPAAPDVVVATEFGLPQLMVYMVSEADGVLVVVGPDGSVHCNDDFDGLNPGVMIPNPAPGDWAVFAGTYGGQGGVATLGVTIASPRWVMDREH